MNALFRRTKQQQRLHTTSNAISDSFNDQTEPLFSFVVLESCMALILSQSPPHSSSNLMYSFFKPALKEQRGDCKIESSQYNGNTHTHSPTDNVQCDAENVNHLAIHTNAEYNALDGFYKGNSKIDLDISSMGDNFDSTSDRRKRRKISAESDGDDGQQILNFNPPSSVSDGDRNSMDLLPETSIEDVKTANMLTRTSSVTPKKPRGRPPKPAMLQKQVTAVNEEVSSTANSSQNMLGSPTSKTRRPVGRNPLRISSSGQLSPTNLKNSSTQSPKTSKRAAANGGRKVTLKNGKFAQSLVVVLKYLPGCTRVDSIGMRVQSVLSKPGKSTKQNGLSKALSNVHRETSDVVKSTHPFFLGKRGTPLSNSLPESLTPSGEHRQGDYRIVSEKSTPVAWKDIVFKSYRHPTTTEPHLDKAPWPPTAYQHIKGEREDIADLPLQAQRQENKKDKIKSVSIAESESVMNIFGQRLSRIKDSCASVYLPQRLYLSRKDALGKLAIDCGLASNVPAIEAARQKALTAYSAFDRAEAAGSASWNQRHSPSTWMEVLQPTCGHLYDWLKSLAVHTIKQGLDGSQSKRPVKRRKRFKKKEDDLLDFIVSEGEEIEVKKVKNAILIVGPTGCGKTAAVYAVAKQLGFEVFEIHPGMRRSQKDIIDKVGDMAQNHMVQRGQTLSRDSSVACDVDISSGQDDYQQPSVASIFAQNTKKKLLEIPKMNAVLPAKQEQKQSLILFEEVDNLFEDDRGFWSGVQGLIQNSKRPVVLTCNSISDIPLDELDLHRILTFTAPPVQIVVPYLNLIAAAEGHAIDPKAIGALYHTKDEDLRATITNLDFWCQMTVGSEKGGLDWYPSTSERLQMAAGDSDLRTFSANTFQRGLDQIPTILSNLGNELQYAKDCFDVGAEDFFENLPTLPKSKCFKEPTAIFSQLEFRSDGDMIPPNAKQHLYVQLYGDDGDDGDDGDAFQSMGRDHLLQVLNSVRRSAPSHVDYECFLPLASERPVFPPSQGRLAPSLDLPRSALAKDVGPYVRSIASFDQRLEQAREELFSSQGKKTRTTRAARAAAEGGDKASTRRERWFPKDLDLQAVQATGNNWPQWYEGQVSIDELSSSPAGSANSPTEG